MRPSLHRVLGVVVLLEAAVLGWLTVSTFVSLEPLSAQGAGMVPSVLLLLGVGGASAMLATAVRSLLRGDGRASVRYVSRVAATALLLVAGTLGGLIDWMLYGSEILVAVTALVFVATLVAAAFILQGEHAKQELLLR